MQIRTSFSLILFFSCAILQNFVKCEETVTSKPQINSQFHSAPITKYNTSDAHLKMQIDTTSNRNVKMLSESKQHADLTKNFKSETPTGIIFASIEDEVKLEMFNEPNPSKKEEFINYFNPYQDIYSEKNASNLTDIHLIERTQEMDEVINITDTPTINYNMETNQLRSSSKIAITKRFDNLSIDSLTNINYSEINSMNKMRSVDAGNEFVLKKSQIIEKNSKKQQFLGEKSSNYFNEKDVLWPKEKNPTNFTESLKKVDTFKPLQQVMKIDEHNESQNNTFNEKHDYRYENTFNQYDEKSILLDGIDEVKKTTLMQLDKNITETTSELLSNQSNLSRCTLIPEISECKEKNDDVIKVHWFYDRIEKQCLSTSDCISNSNKFSTQTECQDACIPKSNLQRCLEPPNAGYIQCHYITSFQSHRETVQMASFDKVKEECSWFVYMGCGGTTNQFKSIDECRQVCMTPTALEKIRNSSVEICQQHRSKRENKLESSCEDLGQYSSRWYYDMNSNHCKEFGYSHCSGRSNNFLTKSACEKFCSAKPLTTKEICQLPVDRGECKQQTYLWFHNASGCHTFNYSGCGGNENRYPSKHTCQLSCRPETFDTTTTATLLMTGTEINRDVTVEPEKDDVSDRIRVTPITKTTEEYHYKPRFMVQTPIEYNLTYFSPKTIGIEPCRSIATPGLCRPVESPIGNKSDFNPKRLIRWFFNPRTSLCEDFVYSGCGGGPNTYDTPESCSQACKQRIMKPERDTRCDNNPIRDKCYSLPLPEQHKKLMKQKIFFFYSISSGTCKAFHLKLDDNQCKAKDYFTDGQKCLHSCRKSSPTERDLPNRCFARKMVGSSVCSIDSHNSSRWSYLSDLKQCVLFSDCHSPPDSTWTSWGNNFKTKRLCELTCMPTGFREVCQLPKDTGPCNESKARYYFDTMARACKLFLYGGCLGNSNRFITRSECEDSCESLNKFYLPIDHKSGSNTTAQLPSVNKTLSTIPPVPAEVFDEMRRITSLYTEPYHWDFCLQQHTYGTCRRVTLNRRRVQMTYLKRYFYNSKTKQCDAYKFTGCGAKGNNFETLSHCNNVCTRRLSTLPSSNCKGYKFKKCLNTGYRVWTYDPSLGTCIQIEQCLEPEVNILYNSDFFYGQQALNKYAPGTFSSSSICYAQCLPSPPIGTDIQNICHMNPITTVPYGCRAMVERWYFDSKDGYCRSYFTCPAYGNNFPNEDTCNLVCRPTKIIDVCRLPLDYGGCTKFQPRWFYNNDKRICEQFYYGGCFGNANRFLTRSECDVTCTDNDICRHPKPPEAKVSQNSTVHYFFNQTLQSCQKFNFTGLITQGNNFKTESICHRECLHVPNLHPISVQMKKKSLSIDRITSKYRKISDLPVRQYGMNFTSTIIPKGPCLSSSKLTEILKNETLASCHKDDLIREIAFFYDDSTNACLPTAIFVCLEYPEELYQFRILDQPLIFKSNSSCSSVCIVA